MHAALTHDMDPVEESWAVSHLRACLSELNHTLECLIRSDTMNQVLEMRERKIPCPFLSISVCSCDSALSEVVRF